jgi:general L-amino acid transport system substrate-binding protein
MQIHRIISTAALLLAVLTPPLVVQAVDLLPTIQARGQLRCGVSEGIPGFSQRDASGRWTGLEAD